MNRTAPGIRPAELRARRDDEMLAHHDFTVIE
jgi:hypothetical protein